LLRIRTILGRRRALFRGLSADGGLNYYEFLLTSAADRGVRAVDFYAVAIGQWESEALRPGILAFVHNNGLADARNQLSDLDKEFIAHAADVVAIVDAARARQPRRVLEIYARLPQSMKRMKSLLNVRLLSAAQVSQQEYLRAFEDFRKYHADAVECYLIALNVFFVQKSYDQALASLDRLDKALGGDPYLKVTRAVILLEQGKTDAARESAERALAEDPTLIAAYELLLSHSLQTRNFAKTVAVLSTLEAKFNWKAPDFTADHACAEFVKSEPYQAWIKSHGQRPAAPRTPSTK
jgi:tetratricopeptide (TPR) repeat protein